MSSFPKRAKKRAINIKALILQSNVNINYKNKNLKLSAINQLFQSNEEHSLTERSEKFRKNSSKKKLEEMCKTMREPIKNSMQKINYNEKNNKKIFFLNNFIKNKNKFITIRKDDSDSLSNKFDTYRENNKLKNLMLEYSDIKPKKQKFLHINKKFINKDKLIKNIFLKSISLINNLSRNNNNNKNICFGTNKSKTFIDNNNENNLTQRNNYVEQHKLNPSLTKRLKHRNLKLPKNKINSFKNPRNFAQLMINKSHKNNNLNPRLKEKINIRNTFNNDIKNNSKNYNQNTLEKAKRIHLLIKQEKQSKQSLNKTLPYRDKLLNDIQKKILIKNKVKLNQINIKQINLIKKQKNSKFNNNTITIPNNYKSTKTKKIKEKINHNINNNTLNNNTLNINNTNNNEISQFPKKTREIKIKIINPKYTKKIIFSPMPPKLKETKLLISSKNKISKKVSKIDSCTLAGYSSTGEQKINQDNLFIKKNFLDEENQFFIGVCDGHGENGHFISSYIAKCVPNFLLDISDKNIISTFNNLNQNLVQNTKIDCSLSGSTCTSIIINQEKIISINLGDSRAVLAKYVKEKEKDKYITINLSTDHKPNLISEKKRILINGGRIKPFYDEKNKKFLGPERIWLKDNEIPGLAMTRSFGDSIAHSVGVISEPEIKKYEITGNERFIIIASDGIWEYITSEECVNIVKTFYENNLDAVGAINAIIKEAFNRWKKYDEIIDDITAIIIFFDDN